VDVEMLVEIVAGVIAAVAGGVFIKCAFCGKPITGAHDTAELRSGRSSDGACPDCVRGLREKAARR